MDGKLVFTANSDPNQRSQPRIAAVSSTDISLDNLTSIRENSCRRSFEPVAIQSLTKAETSPRAIIKSQGKMRER